MRAFPVEDCIKKIELHRLGKNEQAGVAICSLPIPEGCDTHLAFESYAGRGDRSSDEIKRRSSK